MTGQSRQAHREDHSRANVRSAKDLKIVIVGPCAAGTTTLSISLRDAGFDAHPCAQEHSYVPDMWRMSQPDVLIYLDVTLAAIRRRREVSWGEKHLTAENARLAHARQHCDLYIPTDRLTREEVFERALTFLRQRDSAAEGQSERSATSGAP
jgi:hypothetical protein